MHFNPQVYICVDCSASPQEATLPRTHKGCGTLYQGSEREDVGKLKPSIRSAGPCDQLSASGGGRVASLQRGEVPLVSNRLFHALTDTGAPPSPGTGTDPQQSLTDAFLTLALTIAP
ncbi:hypothetical protein AAFF_G00312440 [Aldrovandia affinis]|uniref:Uncharacterized protein n=1 Tax=Aldrovandia affinis TaxID=143900 RepID=A0AAD7WQR7_9TELE|nr:hypothetical protein AAFF_G00312440 [Aldrovandia affinis]